MFVPELEAWQTGIVFSVIPLREYVLESVYQLCKGVVRGESKPFHACRGHEKIFPRATLAILAKTSYVHDGV